MQRKYNEQIKMRGVLWQNIYKAKFYEPISFKIYIYPRVISKHFMLTDVIYIDGTCQNQTTTLLVSYEGTQYNLIYFLIYICDLALFIILSYFSRYATIYHYHLLSQYTLDSSQTNNIVCT